jgi:hypothetical protein
MRLFHLRVADVLGRHEPGSDLPRQQTSSQEDIYRSGLCNCFQSYGMDIHGTADVQLLFERPNYLVSQSRWSLTSCRESCMFSLPHAFTSVLCFEKQLDNLKSIFLLVAVAYEAIPL